MPSHIPAALLTEAQGQSRIFATFEITLGSTVYRFAPEAIASASAGEYLPYVISMSGFGRSVNTLNQNLDIPSPSVTVFDFDRTLQKAIGGPQKGKVRGSAADVWYRSPNVAAASHYQIFDGVVLDYGLSSDRTWQFQLTPSVVQPLLGELKIVKATRAMFPGIPSESEGQPLQVILGRHHSAGTTVAGSVTCFPISENSSGEALDWAVCVAAVEHFRVFRNGTEETLSWNTGWSQIRGDQLIRTIRFTAGAPRPTKDDIVTVDCNGISQTSPLTATDYEPGPTQALAIVLQNFAFDDGSTSRQTWPTQANFDTTYLTDVETYFDARSVKVGRVVQAGTKGIDLLTEICESFNMNVWITDEWKIAFGPEDEADTDIYHDDRLIADRSQHVIGDIRMDTARSKPVSEITTNYLLVDSDGSFHGTRILSDPSITETTKENFDQKAGAASVI